MTLGLASPACASPRVQAAIEQLALNAEADSRGAVFTRREAVDFILDLTGYTGDQPLHEKRLLEPSFGGAARGQVLFHAMDAGSLQRQTA